MCTTPARFEKQKPSSPYCQRVITVTLWQRWLSPVLYCLWTVARWRVVTFEWTPAVVWLYRSCNCMEMECISRGWSLVPSQPWKGLGVVMTTLPTMGKKINTLMSSDVCIVCCPMLWSICVGGFRLHLGKPYFLLKKQKVFWVHHQAAKSCQTISQRKKNMADGCGGHCCWWRYFAQRILFPGVPCWVRARVSATTSKTDSGASRRCLRCPSATSCLRPIKLMSVRPSECLTWSHSP